MKTKRFLHISALICLRFFASVSAASSPPIDKSQIPNWSADDLNFFLHGSMSAEVVPEQVLRAFIKIYPDLFPTEDLSHLGLLLDPDFG